MTKQSITFETYRDQFFMALETEFMLVQDLSHPAATAERDDFMQWARTKMQGDNGHSRGLYRAYEANASIGDIVKTYLSIVLAPQALSPIGEILALLQKPASPTIN